MPKIYVNVIIKIHQTHILFLIKRFYNIVFSTGNNCGNEKSFPSFQVRSNDAVTESLPPSSRAWKGKIFVSLGETSIGFYFRFNKYPRVLLLFL